MEIYIAKTDFLKSEDAFGYYCGLVHPQRAAKIERMRSRKDKELSLLAGLVLREGLLRAGICYDEASISYEEYGKPYLDGGDGKLHFNLSHSGDRVMGIFDRAPVGCDVQRRGAKWMKVAKRFFHAEEYKAIDTLGGQEEREELFFRIWTLKESFMKACGLGMSLDMRSFSVMRAVWERDREDAQRQRQDIRQAAKGAAQGRPLVNPVTQERFYLKEYMPAVGYFYACCASHATFVPEPAELTFDAWGNVGIDRRT